VAKILYASDSLEVILSHLSTKFMDVIADGRCLGHLKFLLEFLAAWEKRPRYLTSMAYQWFCATSEAAARLGPGEIPSTTWTLSWSGRPSPVGFDFFSTPEYHFWGVGPGCDPVRLDNTPLRARSSRQDVILDDYTDLLRMSLKIAFRAAGPGCDYSALHSVPPSHAPHSDQLFEAIFSRADDEVIADAVCTWIKYDNTAPPGSFVRYLNKRLEKRKALSRRLQWASTTAIGRIGLGEFMVSKLETICLLNRLEVDMDDVEDSSWKSLLIYAIRSTTGRECFSFRHWPLLGKVLDSNCLVFPKSRDVEVMKLLEEARDWEKLEIWMRVFWGMPKRFSELTLELMQDVEETSVKFLLHQPSSILRFEDLFRGLYYLEDEGILRRICDRARAEQLPSESPLPLYASVFTAQRLSVLIPPLFLASDNRFTPSHSFPFVLRETTLSEMMNTHTPRQLSCEWTVSVLPWVR